MHRQARRLKDRYDKDSVCFSVGDSDSWARKLIISYHI